MIGVASGFQRRLHQPPSGNMKPRVADARRIRSERLDLLAVDLVAEDQAGRFCREFFTSAALLSLRCA